MPDNSQRYELFIKSMAGIMNGNLTDIRWSWSRLSQSGSILVRGGDHGSLEACFASARRHRAQFDHAPIRINLHKAHGKGASSNTEVPVVACNALFTDLAFDYAQRGAPQAHPLVEAPQEPSE